MWPGRCSERNRIRVKETDFGLMCFNKYQETHLADKQKHMRTELILNCQNTVMMLQNE